MKPLEAPARLRVAMQCAQPWKAGVARQGALVRRRRFPQVPEPITLDHRLDVEVALQILSSQGQAMAFVAIPRGRSGVVTAEDLRFAREWAGPDATVGHAVTQTVIDLDPATAGDPSWLGALPDYAIHSNAPHHPAPTEEP